MDEADMVLNNTVEIAYQEALDYVYSFVDYSLTRNLRNLPEIFDLSRMFSLMELFCNPQQQYPVIHVAGTKGKGSVSALCASALNAAGYRVGFYTSPHLSDYCERIQINGENITHQEFVKTINEMKPMINKVEKLTTFEITTAIAFWYFAQKNIDIAVIEVGLGGRLDATNVVNPIVSVITSLSLDHMNILGDTLAKIAEEKAGIIKNGRPIVLAPQKDEARRVVERIATERKADLIQVNQDYHYASRAHSLEGQSLCIWPSEEQKLVDEFIESGGRNDWEPLRLNIPLLGYHQVENAATAYAALAVCRREGIRIPDCEIQLGFENVKWPGRFEIISRKPLVIVDSAHNRDSALKLRLTLDDYLPETPVILVFGASEDKDVPGMFVELLPRVSRLIATQSVHPRAMEADKLVEIAHQFGSRAQAVLPLEDSLITACEMASDEAIVLVTGSIFVAAAARDAWNKGLIAISKI
jgi:dihydrofolate synthase/folylpolyglutamate synthase